MLLQNFNRVLGCGACNGGHLIEKGCVVRTTKHTALEPQENLEEPPDNHAGYDGERGGEMGTARAANGVGNNWNHPQ